MLAYVNCDGELVWRRSTDGWTVLAEKLAALASVWSGHQYLDGPDDNVQVVAAMREYGESWWSEHGARSV